MQISENIQTRRKQHGWSQSELADKLNVSRQTVSKWELGETLPDTENVLKLCSQRRCFSANTIRTICRSAAARFAARCKKAEYTLGDCTFDFRYFDGRRVGDGVSICAVTYENRAVCYRGGHTKPDGRCAKPDG